MKQRTASLVMSTNEDGVTEPDVPYISGIPPWWERSNLRPNSTYICNMIHVPDKLEPATIEQIQERGGVGFYANSYGSWIPLSTISGDESCGRVYAIMKETEEEEQSRKRLEQLQQEHEKMGQTIKDLKEAQNQSKGR